MKKFILFLIAFFILVKPALALYVNWLQQDNAEQYTETHNGGITGAASNVGDNNLGTDFSAAYACPPSVCPVVVAGLSVIINFSLSNIKIDRTEFTLKTENNVSGTQSQDYYVKVYNGNWYTVSSASQGTPFGQQTITANFSEYSNVSKIEVYLRSGGATNWAGGLARASIYEIKAWGNNYIDIGLRAYDGTGVVKIACEPSGVLSTPLRIYKNGVTYSVALVDPSNPQASKIRIRTNSGIKALVRI